MDYEEILYEVDGTTAVITFNRPARLNAWTAMMEREYRDALKHADSDSGVRAIVVTGAGRGFCAGADMAGLNAIADAGGTDGGGGRRDQALQSVDSLAANYSQHFTFPLNTRKPLLAAINGPAAGLGFVMTLYCDIRFASDQARFGTAFAAIGLIAEHGISWLLPRIVGVANALDLLYSARIIDAQEALRIGLVSRVVPHDELLPAAKEYAAYVATRSSPTAMSVIKRLVYDAQFTDLAKATQAANEAMAESLTRPDFKEGLAAFAEKRPPNFAPLA
jgi:enoyl-CoA hydratase/carnithine racemase